MAIWLDVNTRSGVPIYVQIVEQVKHAIDVGAVQPGEQLPTVRQLSSELTIAPNTIVKAYNELQAMNLVESRAGVGTVVSASVNGAARELQIAALHQRLGEVVRDASSLGIEQEELAARFEAEVENYYDRKRG